MNLQVTDLWKTFATEAGPLEVLRGVSLSVPEGGFVSLVGPSGCGKSTLFNLIAGLEAPDRGTLVLDGRPVGDCRGAVAYMQQKDLLLPWRRNVDNAILGPELRGVARPAARAEATALFQRFGLAGFERAYPADISGGMRQRVALIRTLLFARDLLLLDEPFGALDAMTRPIMQGLLLEVWRDFGKTILFITHDIEEAVLLSDRIYVLTARPGTIKAEMPVTLARPRRVADPAVVALKGALIDLVRAEAEAAFERMELLTAEARRARR
jgi:ABC-type nitrate/sulfonate/bicarbonate transport system ATPase subunit